MYSVIDIPELPGMGFPIKRSPDQCLFSGSPKLIAASHVFPHHPTPRHPPSALSSLAINIYHLYQLLPKFSWHFWNCISLYSIFKEQIKISDFDYDDLSWFALGINPIANQDKSFFFKFRKRNLLVEVNGLEPMTSCVQSRCSPNWATPPKKSFAFTLCR